MAQGLAFGTGSAIAGQAVKAVMGGGSSDKPAPEAPAPVAPTQPASGACEVDTKAFMKCLEENGGSSTNCNFYYTAMEACKSRN